MTQKCQRCGGVKVIGRHFPHQERCPRCGGTGVEPVTPAEHSEKWPKTIYPHGGGREWSTTMDDEWKHDLGVEVVPADDKRMLVEALEEIADALKSSRVGWITATLPREIPAALVKEFQGKLIVLGGRARAALDSVQEGER